MEALVATAAGRLAPVGLEELNAGAALLSRIDTKYIVDAATFAAFTDRLTDQARALEIDARRLFTYETVYFDSGSLLTYRAHVQRRRRRFKCRSRRYVESGLHVFEVKVKGMRGRTIKHQLAIDPGEHGAAGSRTADFVRGVLRETYSQPLAEELVPTLGMSYRRLTLMLPASAERVTCDFGLVFAGSGAGDARMSPNHVILETKSERGRGVADRVLRDLGARAVSCSKYCAGIALTRQHVKRNGMRWLLGRYFVPPAPAAAGAVAGP
jgi:VTC domain